MTSSGPTFRAGWLALLGGFVAIIAVANSHADIVTNIGNDTESVATSDPLAENLPAPASPIPFRPADSLAGESAQFDFMLQRLAELDATDPIVTVDGCFHCYSIEDSDSVATIPEPAAIVIPMMLMLGWVLTTRGRRHLAAASSR